MEMGCVCAFVLSHAAAGTKSCDQSVFFNTYCDGNVAQ